MNIPARGTLTHPFLAVSRKYPCSCCGFTVRLAGVPTGAVQRTKWQHNSSIVSLHSLCFLYCSHSHGKIMNSYTMYFYTLEQGVRTSRFFHAALEPVASYSNIILLQKCTHSLDSDGALWAESEFPDFVKLRLESLVETKMFLLGLPRACPANSRAIWSQDWCACECIELHLGNTSAKLILGSRFLLHRENVTENANIKCSDAAGVRRCNVTTTV